MFTSPNESANSVSLNTHKKNDAKPQNPFNRMHMPGSAAHILMQDNQDGSVTLSQFEVSGSSFYREVLLKTPEKIVKNKEKAESTMIQSGSSSSTPPLVAFFSPSTSQLKKPPQFMLNAYTPNGTQMSSKRSVNINIKEEANHSVGAVQSLTLFFMSPTRTSNNTKVHKPKPSKSNKLTKPSLKDGALNFKSIKRKFDGGNAKTTNPETTISTPLKDQNGILLDSTFKRNRKESPKESEVMGSSAKEALSISLEARRKEFSEETYSLLQSLLDNFALEWLHRIAFSLCPESIEPQDKENISIGGKWINTHMMVLESVGKHFSTLYPGAVLVKPDFELLDDTNIIDKINYMVTIKQNEKMVTVSSSIKALALPDRSNWPSASDARQVKSVVEALITGQTPKVTKRVKFK